MIRSALAFIAALSSASALAVPVTYVLDPQHTYPSFEADHMGGLSVWRGKFTETSGKVIYDKDAKSGAIEVTVKVNSIDFGMPKMDEHAKSADLFDAAKYPTATYSGKFTKFNGAAPSEAQGTLTLHGVTKPVTLPFHVDIHGTTADAKGHADLVRTAFGVGQGNWATGQWVALEVRVDVDITATSTN